MIGQNRIRMSIKVKLPSAIARYTGDQTEIESEGSTISEVIDNMEKMYPGIKRKFVDESGKVYRFVRIYLNKVDIRKLKGMDTPLSDGDELSLVPAFVGG